MRMSVTTSAVQEAPGLGDLATVPASTLPAARGPSSGDFEGHRSPTDGLSPDPLVILRGGRGGLRDDCDLHNRGARPAAVNRMAPPIGGGYGGSGTRTSYPAGLRIR